MASTWSALKVELLETGANAGSWGTLTNANLGDAVLGEAITGQATVDFSSDADVTITLTDAATTQAARNLRLNITESSTGVGSVRNLILGSGCQIEKFYLINNTGTGAKTVKNTSGTGITVPAGKATLVYNNGTNVVDAASYFTSLTLGSALPITSGGTGTTSTTFANLTTNVTGTLPIANGGTGTASTTFANLTTNVTGLLPVANGGTATATPALVQGTGVTITGTWPNQTINATGTGGTVTSVGGTGTVNGISLSGSVTTSGSLTLGGTLSGVDLTSQVTGTLPVANGGTGLATLTANNVLLGNGASAPLFVAPGSSGNVLTSNGSTWASTAPSASGAAAAKTCTFNSSGTWTKPSGYGTTAQVLIQAWGGGASGAKTAFSGAGGGGGGGYNYRWMSIACLASTETVTIGAGGAARTSCVSGAIGGTTTFGSHVSAYGGGAPFSCGANFGYGGGGGGQLSTGGGGSTGPAPGAPMDIQPFYVSAASEWVVFEGAGALYNGTHAVFTKATAGNFKGGGGGASGTSNAFRNGAASVWGGGGGGGARSTCGAGSGGTSSYGGNGGAAAQSGSAVAGTQPAGGGGAASSSATSSGAGGAGRVVVTVYAGV